MRHTEAKGRKEEEEKRTRRVIYGSRILVFSEKKATDRFWPVDKRPESIGLLFRPELKTNEIDDVVATRVRIERYDLATQSPRIFSLSPLFFAFSPENAIRFV